MKIDAERIKKQVETLDNKELIWALLDRRVKLSDVPTFVLCDELRRREGVEEIYVEPHEHKNIPRGGLGKRVCCC